MFHNEDASGATEDESKITPEEEFNQAMNLAMKYAVLSANGVGAELKPYLTLAFSQGFLRPAQCAESDMATKVVVDIYPQVHAVWQQGGEEAAKTFIVDYAMQMLTDPDVVAEEALLAGDMDDDESADDSRAESMDDDQDDDGAGDGEDGTCNCDFCVEMRAMDLIDLSTIESSDPLDRMMIQGLASVLQ
jgi:hypothetical protein